MKTSTGKNNDRHLGESAAERIYLAEDCKDKAAMEAKGKEFQATVAATGVKLGGNVAKMEVR